MEDPIAAAGTSETSNAIQSLHPHPRLVVDHLHAESARPNVEPSSIRDTFQKALWSYHMDLVERAPVNTSSTGIRVDEKARKDKGKRRIEGRRDDEGGVDGEQLVDDDDLDEDAMDRFELCFKPGPGQLPLARVKKVMKTDDQVKMISAEAPIIFAKACEIFIADLTSRAYLLAGEHKRRTIHRSDIAGAIGRSDLFDFLVDVVPREEAQAGGRGVAGKKPRKERTGNKNGDGSEQGQAEEQEEEGGGAEQPETPAEEQPV